MKLIEAMKLVKDNKNKIDDLRYKIAQNSATTNLDTPLYGADQNKQIKAWLQSIYDIGQENIKLLCSIQRTNLDTLVSIEMADGKTVTKSIAEWVWRRREYAELDKLAYLSLTDRNIKEGYINVSNATEKVEVKIVRHFDPKERDTKLELFRSEPFRIDSALEIVNATTELIEFP